MAKKKDPPFSWFEKAIIVWVIASSFLLMSALYENHTLKAELGRKEAALNDVAGNVEFYFHQFVQTQHDLNEMTDYAHKLERKLKKCEQQ